MTTKDRYATTIKRQSAIVFASRSNDVIRKNGLTVKLDVQCVQRQEQADDEETEESVEQSIEHQVPKAGFFRNSLADFYVLFSKSA